MLDTFKKATPEAFAQLEEEMDVRRTREMFLLFSMGSQTDHLIKLGGGKLGVYIQVADPASVTADDVRKLSERFALKGIIISGGPASMETEPPPFDTAIFDLGIPILGICLGFQMWAKHIGCKVEAGARREFGVHSIGLNLNEPTPLFEGLPNAIEALQSHGDEIIPIPQLQVNAWSHAGADGVMQIGGIVAAGSHAHLHGVQFHPEVSHTPDGPQILENFAFLVCGAQDRFPAKDIATEKIRKLKEQIGDKKVLLGLSGGTDSSTVAYLLKEATSGRDQLYGLYIRGVDRPDDEAFTMEYFGNQPWITLIVKDETDAFLENLSGLTEMPAKRLGVRIPYKRCFEETAKTLGAALMAQGTIYTDISESGGGHGSGARKAKIKQHHNTNLDFSIPELTPLDDCVKDGVRDIGRQIGVPEELLVRHPFPGPGLVVRIEGEITPQRLAMARALDGIYIEELRRAGLYETVWQAGVVITQSVHTCTKGDGAEDGIVVVYWAVWSTNGFTAQAAELPFEFHQRISRRFGNEVPGVGAVCYRTSDKPFSTIEWG